VFFDRFSPQSKSSFPSQPKSGRRRNLAALGLAVAMAAPVGLSQFSRLSAEEVKGDKSAGASASDADLLAAGHDQFDQQQYEQAEKTLAGVKTSGLSEKDREGYLALLTDVKHAAIERRTARQELLDGDDALKGQQTLEAIGHFKAAVSNHYADAQTLQKARARLSAFDPDTGRPSAAAPATPALASLASPSSPKQAYELGVNQYHAGDWMHARQNLEVAQAAGFKPASLYQDSPSVILRRMEQRDTADRERVQHLSQLAGPTTAPSDTGGTTDPLQALRATDESRRIRHEQAVAQSREWVKEAQEAQRQNNYDRALDLYTRAVNLDPDNAAAAQGRDSVLTLQGKNPAGAGTLIDQEGKILEARRSEIRYQIQSSLDEAHADIARGEWANAQIAIDRARLGSTADPTIFPPDELRRFRNQIEQTQLDLQQAQERATSHIQSLTDRDIQIRIERQRVEAQRARQRTIGDLIRTSQQLTDQGRYREALQTVDQILILDPINDYAVGVKPLLEDKTQFAEQREFTELRNRKIGAMLNAAEEKQIPYDDILKYPTDWPDISQTRDQTVAAERGANSTDRAVQAQLDRQLPELQFDAIGFSDVIDFLRDVSGSNVFVNWKSLEAAGVDRNTPVTARLHNVKFSKALSIILDSVGGGQTKLGYTVDEGVITISTADDLAKNVVVRVYDIRDLIINVPDFNDAPQFSLDAAQNGGGGGGSAVGQGGGGGSNVTNTLFSGGANQTTTNVGPTREELVESITKLIEDTVTTDSWKDNGGSVGALRELQGQLIVTQTPENHRQLVNLLEQLRETRAIQVTVETRFLIVQRNFLEDVGVDLNFLFNLNSSWSKNFGTIPITSPSSTFTQNPTTGVQGSIGSGTTTPTGLTTSATYLDDFQVQLMMRAVQASVNSTLVTAPRITLFNGQRAYVLVSIQRAYISNLTPVVSTGISSFAPTIGIVQSGVLLDVQATVSADRKYVTLTLRPQLANLLDLAAFTFQQGSSVAATGGGVFGGGFVGVTAGVAPSGTIQEPELQITQVKTTVSVPDGGTLLLGGQTVAGETEREIGAPVLSQIPILRRLFTNRSLAKDEQILLILVRPTIILQREIEQKQFPLLTSKLTNS
jgi:type II secretory pathway component GspD/PulD (secretin)/tetratricopeptide (TPR) repeat protein